MAHGPKEYHRQVVVHSSKSLEVIQNLVVALTVSFVALSLGAAFGVLSGRGAFVGMFSAGVIAFITGCLGGTRVQCSGPVAPMAAVMAVLFATTTAEYAVNPDALGGISPDHFLNLICFICGGTMLLMALFRTGFLISYVPDSVISGFMTGISLIIWIGQIKVLFGLGGTPALEGVLWINLIILIITMVIAFMTFRVIKRFSVHLARVVPGALVAIVLITLVSTVLKLDVQLVSIGATIPGWDGFVDMIKAQIPTHVTWTSFGKALPYGVEFALISYLDTLMVSLIVDRMTGENTRKNKELMAQGAANAAVGFIGGVPGTQASIRSVMMIKEGATMRLAGIMVGVFVIFEMLLLQGWISLIPQAVFIGILMKVGWDVCDKEPIWKFLTRKKDAPRALDFWVIIGTAAVTVYNLTLAVCLFTAIYYLVNYIGRRRVKPHAPTHYVEEQVEEVLHEKL